MTNVACNLCGNDSYNVLFEKGVAQINPIVKCKHCGLMYANPRTKDVDHVLIEDYDPDFVISHIYNQDKHRLEKEALQVRDYETTKRFLSEHFPQKGKLVEVGSGLGYLLNFFKQDGWDVVGLEPNAGMCKYAELELGLTVIPKILEKAGFDDNSADAVLMMHVIEHVPEPDATLKEIYRILKPGGVLVLETPRYDTLVFKLLGKRERSLSCDGHIYFFTSDTLAQIAKKVGFTIMRSDCVGRSLTLERLFYNLGVISKNQFLQGVLKQIATQFQFNKIWFNLNVRDMERIYLKKPEFLSE